VTAEAGGLARAFWAATPEAPDEGPTAELITRLLAELARTDPDAYSGSWYRPLLGPGRSAASEVVMTPAGIRDYLLECSDKGWRELQVGMSFHAWRTAADGTVVFANCSLGTTSPFLRNTVLVGLSAETTADGDRCRRIVELMWTILRPDTADALDAERNEILALGT
jgi:hypothetical protein